MANKTITFDFNEGKGIQPVSERIEKVSEHLRNAINANRELQKEFKESIKHLDGYGVDLKTVSELMVNTTAYLLPQMEQISAMNEKILKKETESNALKQKNVQTDIKGIDDKMAALSKLMKHNSEAEDKIQKKYKEARKANEQRAAKMIADAEGNKEQILKIHLELEERLKEIEEIRKYEINQHHKAIRDMVNKTFDEQTSLYEKKKALINEEAELQKHNSEIAYNTAIERQKAIVIHIESLDAENQNLEKNIRKKEEATKTIEELERRKAENIKAIDEDLNHKLNENTKAQLAETTAMVDKTITELSSRSEKNAKNGLGLIDYKKTKENLQSTQDQLKQFKTTLEADRDAKILYYASLEKMYADDPVKLKQAQDEKIKVMEQFKTNFEKIDKSITDSEKKEQKLRMEQYKDYNEKYGKISKKIQDGAKDAGKLIEDHFKSQIKSIDNQIKEMDNAQEQITKDQESYKFKLESLQLRALDTSKQMTEAEIAELQKLENREKENVKKKEELEKEKEKKVKEREKADKLRRKGEIIKNIGEAAADISKGVTKALSLGPILGPIGAALVAAYGVVQIGQMTAQLAKFEDGGLLKGRRHAQGGMRIEGTNIEVEGGEYVVNRESTHKNLGLIRYINSQRKELRPQDINGFFATPAKGFGVPFGNRFEAGGALPAINNTSNIENDALVDAIRSMKFEPKVAVTDIIRAQDEMATVSSWTGV